MAALQYSSLKQGSITIITVGGSLDVETAPGLNEKLLAELKKGSKNFVINLAKLSYIASAGLGVLISFNKTLSGAGGEIRLSSMSDKVTKIFKLLGFINLFKTHKNDQEAIKSF